MYVQNSEENAEDKIHQNVKLHQSAEKIWKK